MTIPNKCTQFYTSCTDNELEGSFHITGSFDKGSSWMVLSEEDHSGRYQKLEEIDFFLKSGKKIQYVDTDFGKVEQSVQDGPFGPLESCDSD